MPRPPHLECIEVPLPSPGEDGRTTAVSHAFPNGEPGTRCQCGQTVLLGRQVEAAAADPFQTRDAVAEILQDGGLTRYSPKGLAELLMRKFDITPKGSAR